MQDWLKEPLREPSPTEVEQARNSMYRFTITGGGVAMTGTAHMADDGLLVLVDGEHVRYLHLTPGAAARWLSASPE